MASKEPGRPLARGWLDLVQTLCETGRLIDSMEHSILRLCSSQHHTVRILTATHICILRPNYLFYASGGEMENTEMAFVSFIWHYEARRLSKPATDSGRFHGPGALSIFSILACPFFFFLAFVTFSSTASSACSWSPFFFSFLQNFAVVICLFLYFGVFLAALASSLPE